MEKIKWSEKVTNEEDLHRKANWRRTDDVRERSKKKKKNKKKTTPS